MPMPSVLLLSDVADLVLGRCCLGCQTPGPSLCTRCLMSLRRLPVVLPASGRMPAVVSGTPYVGLAQRSVIAYKEHANRSLARPLGLLLADSVGRISRQHGLACVTLVPVPGHRRGDRGFDALGGIVRHAVGAIEDAGVRAPVRRLLRPAAVYSPLKGLGRDERFALIAGAFRLAPGAGRGSRPQPGPVVIVDDVITTGATVTEAVRVLLGVVGIATVASTPAGQRRAW
jgi:predicted amidophosphoribosyltransferase